MAKRVTVIILLVLTQVCGPSAARALQPHERSGWYGGLGFGPARGAVHVAEEEGVWWDTGSTPQIRLGKMLSSRFGLGLDVQTWFNEFGSAGEDLPLQLKIRITGNIWALAGSWFPGAPDSFWGGFFARAGVGPAIANYAAAIPDPSDPTGGREIQVRIDEWGWGVMIALGYEFRISRHFAAGLQISSNYLWINEEIERVWFGGPVLQLLWYF